MAKGETPSNDTHQETAVVQTFSPKNSIAPEAANKKLSLEKWTESIFQEDPFPTVNLSRYGIKNASDLAKFMRSPAGETVLAEISKELAIEKAIQEEQQLQIREHAVFMHRLRAALFLWFLEEEAEASSKVKELILEHNDKAIKDSAKASTPTPKSDQLKAQEDSLNKAIADYTKAIEANQKQLSKVTKDGEEIDKQLNRFKYESELIPFKYELYAATLEDFQKTLVRFEKSASLSPDDPEYMSEADLQKVIDLINEQMDGYLLEVDRLLKSGDDEQATLLMKSHTALQLKLGDHYDAMAVRRGEKYYADENGVQVKSIEDAHFILDTNANNSKYNELPPEARTSKIIKVDNTYYLLKPGQNWDSIKDDEIAKQDAHKNYNNTKHEILVVKKVVTLNKGLETELQTQKLEEANLRKQKNDDLKTLLTNQDGVLKAALASTQNLLKNPTLGLNAPTPTVTAGVRSGTKPNYTSTTAFFREQLDINRLCNLENIREILPKMALQAPGPNGLKAHQSIIEQLRLLPSTGPIPQQIMTNMLRTLESFGIDTTKPSVTSIVNPLELIKQQKLTEEEPELRSTHSLTPLSTDPFK